ncbi:MAG: lipoprotein [Herminiimonas sp.]|nr:lipoprotein [Herminiimonas sp.]
MTLALAGCGQKGPLFMPVTRAAPIKSAPLPPVTNSAAEVPIAPAPATPSSSVLPSSSGAAAPVNK